MDLPALKTYTAQLVAEHGAPQVLDVEYSIHTYKPILSGSSSPASYYILPPPDMTAEQMVEWFQSIPDFPEFRLTLVPITGLDTFHQPLISTDDFAKKHFHDNHMRILRVVGKSDHAIDAMATFIEALKHPFDAAKFPHHADFAISAFRAPEEGRMTEAKLLYLPANHNNLMRIERDVSIHLAECNLEREVWTSRHATRDQAPELMLTCAGGAPAGIEFVMALVRSLPTASPEEIAEATEKAEHNNPQAPVVETPHARFTQVAVPVKVLSPNDLKREVLVMLCEIMKGSHFGGTKEIQLVQAGSKIEVKFPRKPGSLWLSTTFDKVNHIKELARICTSIKSDPVLRDGWSAIYNYDSKSGTLSIRALETGGTAPPDWVTVQA